MQSGKHLVLSVFVLAVIAFCAGSTFAETSNNQRLVYENSFEETVGSEWSNRTIEFTPKDGRRFLGQFGNDTVTLTLDDLPPHSTVTVSFDLFIIHTWDGNYNRYGPDFWSLSVTDGPVLLRTTFSNSLNHQSYPDISPQGDHRPCTGADEVDTLGYTWRDKTMDSVYRRSFTFSHTGNYLQLCFFATGLES